MAGRILREYLSGSYKRETAIARIDDVDIVFIIDPGAWPGDFFGLSDFPQPNKVLETFARAIRLRYPQSSVFTQRRSVRLQLYHLDIDVVPAVEDIGDPEIIYIPDVQEGSWISTSPKKHSAQATRVNQARDGRLKPLIKLLKFWNSRLPSTARFKSFALESIAVILFDRVNLPSLQHGLLLFFDFVVFVSGGYSMFEWNSTFGISLTESNPHVPDTAGTGKNIIEGIDASVVRRFAEQATRSRNQMSLAEDAGGPLVGIRHVRDALKW